MKLKIFYLFIAAWALLSFAAYLKYPENFLYPNFFAEDGQHFYQNIHDHGLLQAAFTKFNGYFIVGIYVLTKLGLMINNLIFEGLFYNIPKSLSVISYLFFGLCSALPIVLLRSYLKIKYLVVISLLIALVPLPNSDFTMIGTIGNLKFAFGYIAFLLALYRIQLNPKSNIVFFVDICILLCVYTVGTSYLVLPFIIYYQYIFFVTNNKFIDIRNSIISIAVLTTLSILQIALIIYYGLPSLKGYLDEPYQFEKTVEIFLGRSILFPLIPNAYGHLNDLLAILTLSIFIFLITKYSSSKSRIIYLFGGYFVFFSILILVMSRTGISAQYNNYSTTGLDNFFYTQNYISVILFITLYSDISKKILKQNNLIIFILLISILFIQSIAANINHPPNYFMHYMVGTLESQLRLKCSSTDKSDIKFSIYPFSFLSMQAKNDLACDGLSNEGRIDYLNSYTDLREPIEIGPNKNFFTQKFKATKNNLSGVAVFVSTYSKTNLAGYEFYLMSSNCENILRMTRLPFFVRDNSILVIKFDEISTSKDEDYCFSIRPTNSAVQPLVIYRAVNSNNKDMSLRLNGVNVDNNLILFSLFN